MVQPMRSSDVCPVSGQSFVEEVANCLTHGVGLVLAVVGLVVLVVFASLHGDARHIVSFSIYGALVLLYGSSTLYHASRRLQ